MNELKKTLGAFSGTAMMLNVVLGTGLLILPGLAAKVSGLAAFWAWVAAAAVSIPLLWVFALLSALFPHTGGIAHIVGQTFGRRGFVAASLVFLGAVSLGLPSVALTGGYYYASLASAAGAPAWLADANLAALCLLGLACGLNLYAPDTARKIGASAAVLIGAFLCCMIAAGALALSVETTAAEAREKLHAIIAPAQLEWRAASAVFFMVFFAFTGWEVAVGMGGEFKNPSRNIPVAIAASFSIAVALSMGCVLLVLLAGPDTWHEAAFATLLPARFGGVLAAGAVLFITINLFAAIWSVSRLLFTLAGAGVLPPAIGRLSAGGAPRNAVLLFLAVGWSVLLAERASPLAVDDFLSYAGLNFFVLYGLMTLVAVCKLDGIIRKTLAGATFALVCALLIFSATPRGIVYPLALAGFGVIAIRAGRRPATRAQG